MTTHPLELHEVLENPVHLAWGRLRSRGRLVRDSGALPQVLGNSVQLAQVFTHLLINAAQALPRSGGEGPLTTRLHGTSQAVRSITPWPDDAGDVLCAPADWTERKA